MTDSNCIKYIITVIIETENEYKKNAHFFCSGRVYLLLSLYTCFGMIAEAFSHLCDIVCSHDKVQ